MGVDLGFLGDSEEVKELEDFASKLYVGTTECMASIELKYQAEFGDGVQGWDIVRFILHTMKEAIEWAEKTGAHVRKAGAIKKDWAVRLIKRVYFHFDPDIPYVPFFIESKIESYLLDKAVPQVIDFLVGLYNANVWKKEQS